MTVAILFARKTSIYKKLPLCDVYDIERDARTFTGGMPVVAHPPCRAWGTLAHMAKPRDDERSLAPWAIEMVRKCGGVLEHPKRSKLWPELGLPQPGAGSDEFGGWTLGIAQRDFGHRAEKLTLLYIVGCARRDLPPIPFVMGEATHVVATSGRRRDGTRYKHKKECTKAERERTPVALAEWLVEVARRCTPPVEA